MVEGNFLGKHLMMIILYFCKMKQLLSCHIYVYELTAVSVSNSYSRLTTGVGKVTRMAKPEHLYSELIGIRMFA